MIPSRSREFRAASLYFSPEFPGVGPVGNLSDYKDERIGPADHSIAPSLA